MPERDYTSVFKDNRPTDIFDQWREAKARFDKACHQFAQAQQERSTAEKLLRDVTDQVASELESGVYDPTMPMPAKQAVPQQQGGRNF